jgi:hypothetical protein
VSVSVSVRGLWSEMTCLLKWGLEVSWKGIVTCRDLIHKGYVLGHCSWMKAQRGVQQG